MTMNPVTRMRAMPKIPQYWAFSLWLTRAPIVTATAKNKGDRNEIARPVVAYSPKTSPDLPSGIRRAR